MEKNRFACLSGSTLKMLAMVLMLVDHVGAVILENGYLTAYNMRLPKAVTYDEILHILDIDRILRFIGRSAFPIFCFLLVIGFMHTSNKKKYAFRLFLFALLSEIPFDLAFANTILEFQYQNVMFTLLIGFLAMMALEHFESNYPVMALIVVLSLGLGYLLRTDYSYKGVALILVLYFFRFHKVVQTLAGCISLLWEAPACLAFLPIRLYNGKKGIHVKYVFYFFYPVHILMLCVIRYFMFQDIPYSFTIPLF